MKLIAMKLWLTFYCILPLKFRGFPKDHVLKNKPLIYVVLIEKVSQPYKTTSRRVSVL
jgi:hypothetical protein